MKLITDENILRQPCERISVSKGLQLGRKMINFLLSYNKRNFIQGIGLAAPQIGERVRVCVLLFDKPLTLINPEIVKNGNLSMPWTEGCLSMPGKTVNTFRWRDVVVRADNIPLPITFSKFGDYKEPLQSVVVQHEIDHLAGILMDSRTIDLTKPYEGLRLGMSNANPGGELND